jgi:hypothetical protein
MKLVRTFLAATSVAAVLGLGVVVAFAAPGSVAKTASPNASAAHAVYCPAEEKDRRTQERNAYKASMKRSKAAYFRTHTKAKARAAFTKAQIARLNKLNRSLNSCE